MVHCPCTSSPPRVGVTSVTYAFLWSTATFHQHSENPEENPRISFPKEYVLLYICAYVRRNTHRKGSTDFSTKLGIIQHHDQSLLCATEIKRLMPRLTDRHLERPCERIPMVSWGPRHLKLRIPLGGWLQIQVSDSLKCGIELVFLMLGYHQLSRTSFCLTLQLLV
jgi:hypothetical protein